MFTTFKLNDYCNFKDFRMEYSPDRKKDDLNLNILVGRNGSGKSTLLDALFEIGCDNLESKTDKSVDNCIFKYTFLNDKEEIILGNDSSLKNKKTEHQYYWDKVIKHYTGNTKRHYNFNNFTFENQQQSTDIILLSNVQTKWALLALFFSGKWQNKDPIEKDLWDKVQILVLGNNPKDECTEWIDPKIIWIETNLKLSSDVNNGDKVLNEFDTFIEGLMIRKPDFSLPVNNGNVRHFWKLDNQIQLTSHDNSFAVLTRILESLKITNEISDEIEELVIFDSGFLFSKVKGCLKQACSNNKNCHECSNKIDGEKLFPEQSLSDGELAFFTRFALIMILREAAKHEKYLVLFDEPEVHFNEYWKSYYLYLLAEALKDTCHDVFIATHSAMLVTDAKPEEIHRLEARTNGIIHYPVPIKTYGASIVDIGRSLFMMEADIGERSRQEIEKAINNDENLLPDQHKSKLEDLLKQVGPGEWRWKLRITLKDLETRQKCKNYAPEKTKNKK